ncbi:4-hydroxy-3-methylbut-2-enyl diphosphate reductase [Sphingosinicella sp. GR2756]|uniref:4-hydroxy-3-methylbut-2-enyl diphosphate reductase n=2 Tax=Sphingosinicella rhizophila TaxID=3050082 RepID=A0ABU3Q6N4_9SPHN|nr:4-hydroxy-3-methylbut-2-enyl diphosphate reductase [Sphingosinicella sp. GR2756]
MTRGRPLPPLRVLLAAPRGFCAGVRRAIDAVEQALRRFGPPVFVRRAIVHNLAVVRSLEAKGAIFVEELSEVPDGAVVILSAHGVARHVEADGRNRGQRVFNAICPLVAKVHQGVVRHHQDGRRVILIGHEGHPETIGTLGQLPEGAAFVVDSAEAVQMLDLDPGTPVAYAVQTTYSADEAAAIVAAIEARFSDARGPRGSDICYATTNRQAAVRSLAPRVDAMIVAGEHFSSNACRLAEVASAFGCPSVQLVADASHVDWSLLTRSRIVAITSAASTPEATVEGIVAALAGRFDVQVEEVEHVAETVSFKPLKIH